MFHEPFLASLLPQAPLRKQRSIPVLAPAGDLLFLPQEKKAKELGALPSS